jgi:peptidoglycan/LPS O-acetylase OafA/YrhL
MFARLESYGFGSQRSIPGLDGLRAVSILLVMGSHMTSTRPFPAALRNNPVGNFGVLVFFVISGFLITSVLIREIERTGTISLPQFYFRRALRLFPACYVLIGVVAALAHWRLLDLNSGDLTAALTYTMNFHPTRAWSLGHLWTLAVEEQFYLLWPWLLGILGARRAIPWLLGMLVAAPLLRVVSPYAGVSLNFFIASDCLATGCLLALCRSSLAANPVYSRLLSSRWFWLIPFAALFVYFIPSINLLWLAGIPFMNFAIAGTLDWAMRNTQGLVGRSLNSPVMRFLGVLSYSLYLWQQIFFNPNSNSPLCAFPLNLIATFLAALASYLLIECPFLRLRARWRPAKNLQPLPSLSL